MKLRLLSACATLFAFAAVAACATSAETRVAGSPAGPGNPDGTPAAPDSDDPADQPPHSLGTIVLGESHASGTSRSTPIVSATFVPDALLTRTCKTTIDESCVIQQAPKCTKVSTSSTGCDVGEGCVLDNTSCKATCKALPICKTTCSKGEVCTLSSSATGSTSNGQDVTGICQKATTFDAGPLAFSGTTTPITMFPPYAFESRGDGAPFLGGAELRVQASGATTSGFDKFDESFTATTFVQTSPALSDIPRATIFGTGSIPISWAPADDTILITLGGVGGSAICTVKDSLGTFDVSRAVVDKVLGDGTTGTAALSITVSRQKKDVKKDLTAKGSDILSKVQPVGWLELVTLSSESASFQGCSAGAMICDDQCVDVQSDSENCGSCGKVCSGGVACNNGTCGTSSGGGGTGTCDTCTQNAITGSGPCVIQYNACQADTNCVNLANCLGACTTAACQSTCQSTYPTGMFNFGPAQSCLSTACGSVCN